MSTQPRRAGDAGPSPPDDDFSIDLPDMPRLLAGIDADDGQPLTRLAMRLLVLTLARNADLRRARWTEFNLQASEWRIPSGRDAGTVRVLPLSRQALDTLLEIRKYRGGTPWVFPGQRDAGRPIHEATLAAAFARAGGAQATTSPGRLRAAARALLGRAGWDVRSLDAPRAPAGPASEQGASSDDECRRMMQAWADQLDAWRASAARPASRPAADAGAG